MTSSPIAPAITRLRAALGDDSNEDATTARRALLTDALTWTEGEPGLTAIASHAADLARAGMFAGGPWALPSRLLPQLVRGGLLADDLTAMTEVLSELRMLAIARSDLTDDELDAAGARAFLRDVVVLNLDLLVPTGSEDERNRPTTYQRARALLTYLLEQLSPELVQQAFVQEIEQRIAQRPVDTAPTLAMLRHVPTMTKTSDRADAATRLLALHRSATAPSALCKDAVAIQEYRARLRDASASTLAKEARAFGGALRQSGIGTAYHAAFIRHAVDDPDLVVASLRLDRIGEANFRTFLPQVRELIDVAILPETSFALFGFARMLERGLMSSRAVVGGLRRLMNARLTAEATRRLMASEPASTTMSATSILIAGALAVLGLPLGIAQGNNPTCQSARAISLWSQHAPGYLLNLLCGAVRDGRVRMGFEGQMLYSDQLTLGVAKEVDLQLDPVSRVLVPHLDRLYNAMMERAQFRPEDPHRWVNPAFYGRFVPEEFACAVGLEARFVNDYAAFIRLFFATHHPSFNENDELVHPNPVGLLVTNVHGDLLGAHAVSLLRVAEDPRGEIRAYFFNPNHEGRQDWGLGVRTSVHGLGEVPGESSLPFEQFASRLYAFHYHAYEGGEADAVPEDMADAVIELARASWGRGFTGWPPSKEELASWPPASG